MVIKKGDYFECIKDVIMEDRDEIVYIKGKQYRSDQDNCITNELGGINHYWNNVTYTEDHFKKFNPNDKCQKESGVKNDSDKLPYYTVLFKQFPLALREVVKCSKAGNQKYKKTDSDFQNFSRVQNAETRYKDAMLRHLLESGLVEDMKEYGEMTHEAAVVWNALADLEIKLRSKNENN